MKAVLLQEENAEKKQPVVGFSKNLLKHQWENSTIEREALALELAVQHFEVYVANGETVLVYSDHNPLLFLAKFHTANSRVFCWSLGLQSYNLLVVHVARKENEAADDLLPG